MTWRHNETLCNGRSDLNDDSSDDTFAQTQTSRGGVSLEMTVVSIMSLQGNSHLRTIVCTI